MRPHPFHTIILVLVAISLLGVSTGFIHLNMDRIMFRMVTQSLQDGKVSRVEADLYFTALDSRLVTRFHEPVKQVAITNRFGELSIYNESAQTVFHAQGQEYSSENHMIYYFLRGRTRDLGLRELGFKQTHTEISGDLVISQWEAPASVRHIFSRIELVHQDFMPIYAGYYGAEGDMLRKVYYTDYENLSHFRLPLSITEFNYLPEGDSIINRVRISDVLINQDAHSSWFEFEIPSHARIID